MRLWNREPQGGGPRARGSREIKSGEGATAHAARCRLIELRRTFRTPKSACEGLAEEILKPRLMADVVEVEVQRKKLVVTLLCFCPDKRLPELLALQVFKDTVGAFQHKFRAAFPKHQLELRYECDPSATDERFAVVLKHNNQSVEGLPLPVTPSESSEDLGPEFEEYNALAVERMRTSRGPRGWLGSRGPSRRSENAEQKTAAISTTPSTGEALPLLGQNDHRRNS